MEFNWGNWPFSNNQKEEKEEVEQEEIVEETQEEVVETEKAHEAEEVQETTYETEEATTEEEAPAEQVEEPVTEPVEQPAVAQPTYEEPSFDVPSNTQTPQQEGGFSNFDEFEDYDTFSAVAKIKVVGVGGAGNNAVNRMIDEEISNVEFYVMNTDRQALSTSKARNRIILGGNKYRGLGAGGNPLIGAEAAELSANDIRAALKGADMVFIAAGEGGGTGTGAAPVVARIAKEEGALTVAIVTRPFNFEGKRRIAQAVDGLNKLKEHVDSIIVVSNDKLLMMNGGNSIMDAFAASDKVLAQSVKTVSDLITLPGIINLDFADIRSTLKDSGVALIGFGSGKGQNKVRDAASSAISSPLLEASIRGANSAIISVTCGSNVTLYEAQDAANEICAAAGNNLDMKYGVNFNTQLGDEIIISVIATDFSEEYDFSEVPNISQLKPRTVVEKSEEQVEEKEENTIIPSYLQNQK